MRAVQWLNVKSPMAAIRWGLFTFTFASWSIRTTGSQGAWILHTACFFVASAGFSSFALITGEPEHGR